MPYSCRALGRSCSHRRLQGWKEWHKKECKTLRGTEIHSVDAILFAPDELEPRMIKIPWRWHLDAGDDPVYTFQKLLRRPWQKNYRSMEIWTQGQLGPPLPGGRALLLYYNDDFSIDGSPLNRCVSKFTKGKAPHAWGDGIFVVRREAGARQFSSNTTDEDAVMDEDLGYVVQFLEDYGKYRFM